LRKTPRLIREGLTESLRTTVGDCGVDLVVIQFYRRRLGKTVIKGNRRNGDVAETVGKTYWT